MRLSTGVLLTTVLVWSGLVAATVARHAASPSSTIAHPQLPAAAASARPSKTDEADGYLGSASCRRCHEAEHGQWERSLHVKMTKPIAEAAISGDFRDGTKLSAHGRSYEFGTRNGRPFIRVAFGDRAPETFTVDYTLGAKRYQGYLSTLPDGRMYVLPAFWHVDAGRWIDWKEITPIPDGAHDLRQIWNANCFNCHATNLVQGYDVAAKRYSTTWSEMGIGCEACHGPGREHTALMDEWEKNPATKSKYDTSPENPQLTDVLKTLSTRSAPPRRTFDTCAYCHGNKTNLFTGFKAGDRYEDYALPFMPSDEIPANDLQGEFWPDGRPNRFNRNQALMLSGCFQAGAITCTACHVGHGSRYEHSLKVNIYQGRYGDTLCTQCHQQLKRVPGRPTAIGDREAGARAAPAGSPADAGLSFMTAEGLRAHTFHEPDGEGSRCIGCHMSDVNWRMLVRRRDHTFRAPTPEVTARYGVPNACTTCHDDKSPEWAARQMDAWWGDGSRRQKQVSVADVLYRAGSGDASVLPQLGRLAIDRDEGALIRASAADYVTRLLLGTRAEGAKAPSESAMAAAAPVVRRQPVSPDAVTTELVNRLIAAAADREAVVRAAAIRALAATGQIARVVPPLTARLVDQARAVRVRAAEALLTLGVAELPGPAGSVLKKAQDEYALSLTSFPDVAANHASLGWLEAERGRLDAAQQALDRAIHLDPETARPYVLKGVLAARGSRFQEAIDLWRKAKSLDQGYPRIDALIEEAEKRKAGAR